MAEPAAGFDGAVHRFAVRVYYEDTDAAGVVYHANYLKFAERARSEMLRELGFDHLALFADCGANFTVRRCEVDYLRPAHLDDEVEVSTRLTALGGASARLEQVIRRRGDDLARLNLRLALVTGAGRPARLPNRLRDALAPLLQPANGS